MPVACGAGGVAAGVLVTVVLVAGVAAGIGCGAGAVVVVKLVLVVCGAGAAGAAVDGRVVGATAACIEFTGPAGGDGDTVGAGADVAAF